MNNGKEDAHSTYHDLKGNIGQPKARLLRLIADAKFWAGLGCLALAGVFHLIATKYSEPPFGTFRRLYP